MKTGNKQLLFEVADRQRGYFTSQQAEQCGFHRSHFHRFLKSGEWEKEMRGIYRLSQYPVQGRYELVLWSLWSRNKKGIPQGVWSYETALDIHELTDVMPPKMHLTVPGKFRRNQKIPALLVLYRQDLVDDDVEIHQGYRVTKPLKTLIDVEKAQIISSDQIKLGVHQAIKRGLISKHEIQRHAEGARLLRYIDDDTV